MVDSIEYTTMEWNSAKHEAFDYMERTPQVDVHNNTDITPVSGRDKPRAGSLYSKMGFSVEAAGSGAAGTAPNVGPLLIACGMPETVSASVSVVYDVPLTKASTVGATAQDIDKFLGNELKHECNSAVGNVMFTARAGEKAFWTFDMSGIYAAPTEASSLASLGTTARPPVAKGLTVTVGGATLVLKEVTINHNNTIASPRKDIAGTNGVQAPKITASLPTMQIKFERTALATFNPWTVMTSETSTALALVLGGTAGNILTITGDWYPLDFPDDSEEDKILVETMNFQMGCEIDDILN